MTFTYRFHGSKDNLETQRSIETVENKRDNPIQYPDQSLSLQKTMTLHKL